MRRLRMYYRLMVAAFWYKVRNREAVEQFKWDVACAFGDYNTVAYVQYGDGVTHRLAARQRCCERISRAWDRFIESSNRANLAHTTARQNAILEAYPVLRELGSTSTSYIGTRGTSLTVLRPGT